MGMDKPFVRFRNGYLLDAVIARAEPQSKADAECSPEQMARCQSHYGEKFVLLADAFDGAGAARQPHSRDCNACLRQGPVAGHVSCDTPFLPRDIVARLREAAADGTAMNPIVAVAWDKCRACALCGLAKSSTFYAMASHPVNSAAFERMLDASAPCASIFPPIRIPSSISIRPKIWRGGNYTHDKRINTKTMIGRQNKAAVRPPAGRRCAPPKRKEPASERR